MYVLSYFIICIFVEEVSSIYSPVSKLLGSKRFNVIINRVALPFISIGEQLKHS